MGVLGEKKDKSLKGKNNKKKKQQQQQTVSFL